MVRIYIVLTSPGLDKAVAEVEPNSRVDRSDGSSRLLRVASAGALGRPSVDFGPLVNSVRLCSIRLFIHLAGSSMHDATLLLASDSPAALEQCLTLTKCASAEQTADRSEVPPHVPTIANCNPQSAPLKMSWLLHTNISFYASDPLNVMSESVLREPPSVH